MAAKYRNDFLSRHQPVANNGRIKIIWQILVVGLVIYLSYRFWLQLNDPHTLPFKQVKIIATYRHIQPTVLKAVVGQNLSGGFFSLNADKLRQHILNLPWVANVSVRRIWPSTLLITIQEKHAIARWGNQQVVNAKGELFTPSAQSIPNDLPVLIGPNNSKEEVLNKFQYFNQLLSTINLKIAELSLSRRQAWRLRLHDGIEVVIGRYDVDQRFAQFVRLFPKLIGDRWRQVDYVDLRYQNGLAIRWKHGV